MAPKDAKQTDVLLFWPMNLHGYMIDKMLHRFYNFRRCNERAIFIPSTIIAQGQLISCPEIVHKSKPCPQAYQGVDLSVINDLAITFYYDIERSTLVHEVYSAPFDLITLPFDTVGFCFIFSYAQFVLLLI
ncbi:unnamed protein product [Gongylonema pulchrum]|uniref:Flavodoxin-like domain-containing protein n=1 Tax=Gongylonema pulchrum TaxID=637853 RepID=A0A183EW09_9BILA|nr:unnamed protein product [Gongylonema pulchrum]